MSKIDEGARPASISGYRRSWSVTASASLKAQPVTKGDPVRRLIVLLALLLSLAFPASVLGFHHGGLPSTFCTPTAAGDPSNTNGRAREALSDPERAGLFPPALPPVGTPGAGKGQGELNCAETQP